MQIERVQRSVLSLLAILSLCVAMTFAGSEAGPLPDRKPLVAQNAKNVAGMQQLADLQHSVIDCATPHSSDYLAALLQSTSDGVVRAQALQSLARRDPAMVGPILHRALSDKSEQVCLAALELTAATPCSDAASRVIALASSARPTLRRRAAEVLGRLGLANDPVEYGECVMQSAQELADQLERLGIDVARAVLCCEPNEPFANEELVREAEAYLDRAADRDVSCADFRGVLFLAAASITQQRKLTLRLWEYEINRTDSDDQLLDHALQSAARSRLLAGLAAIRGGSLDRGLADLSEVVRLGSGSAPTSGLRVYAAQAGIMSSVIRRSEPVYPRYRARQVRHTPSSVTRAVSAVLGDFDLARPEQREEAGHRLDQWCGLNVAPRQKHLGRLQTLAN